MTDRERIEKTYAKIKKKYPDVVNKEQIDALAIKEEKRTSLLCCLGLAAGAIVCFIIGALIKSETYSETRYILLITGAFQIYEVFKIFSKYSKIEKMYKPVETVSHQGTLTQERVLKDGGKLLKKAAYQFVIAKLPLFDKEDETEVGLDNITSHIHRLYFKIDEYGRTAFIKINRDTYMNATIGAMYYVVLTQQNEIAAAYQASNWDLGADVLPYCKRTEGEDEAQPETEQKENRQSAYEPAPVVRTTEKEKTKKLLPILAMVLIVVSYFTIILVGVPLGIAALVMAIVALTQQRSKLSITSMIVTALLFALLVLSVAAAFMS